MKFLIILFICSISFVDGISQNKRDNVWLFGIGDYEPETPGFQSYRFDFNTKPFTPIKSDNGIGIGSNNASISDEEGKLLFYTNGCAVLNANSEIMPNGEDINPGYFFEEFWLGDCNNGYPGTQNIIALTDPAYENGYFLIHKPVIKEGTSPSFTRDILFTYVDMTLNNNLGNVIAKNEFFYNENKTLSNYLTAIHHTNGKDWWIIQPLKDTTVFLTFLLDKNGFHRKQDQNTEEFFDYYRSSGSGTAKFSPNGTKYALYNYYDGLHIYDFDRLTGELSNHIEVVLFDSIYIEDYRFSSVEWSPNSRFIYTASSYELHQIDTWESDLLEGIILIDTYDGT